jgi:hypothetical protein
LGYCEDCLNTAHRSLTLLAQLRAWLSPADRPRSADLLFVLAGRPNRKNYALELFREGLAPRILFSVSRFEIRRFSQMALPVPLDLLKIAQEVPPPQRHYFVFFEGQKVRVERVPRGRFGTLTEIKALARWLGENQHIRSVLAVSSDTHLRRIRMCCRSLLKATTSVALLSAPLSPSERISVVTEEQQQGHLQPEESSVFTSAKDDLLELFKLAIYWVLLKFR